jgi:DNA-binding NarL/FixJ family response regulator
MGRSTPSTIALSHATPAEVRPGCVLVANPHPQLVNGLRGLLEAVFESVFIVADRLSLCQGARKLQPALLVIDLTLAEGGLADLLADLRRQAPQSHTLLLSDHDDPGVDTAALRAGADGIVHKATLAMDLFTAVDTVLAGRRFVSPSSAH